MMTGIKIFAILNFIFFAGMLTVNALANILPINGYNTGELSDLYPNLFVPAGITFSIWGVIYLLLLISSVAQIVMAFTSQEDISGIGKMSIFFIISCILNMGWILAWHYRQLPLSLIIMAGLFICLLILYGRLGIGNTIKNTTSAFLVDLPISIYLGWISIALIANATAFFVDIGWEGFGISPELWTAIMMAIGTVLGIIYVFKNHDAYYAAVIIWALIGIYIKQSKPDNSMNIILITAICGIIILAGSLITGIIRKGIYY
ncbi:MAG: TspO/MBR family protein [Saccharofermentanales bacterium]